MNVNVLDDWDHSILFIIAISFFRIELEGGGTLGDDRLEELQEAYGYSLVIHKEYSDFSAYDRDILDRMVQKYKTYAESHATIQSRGMWPFLINTVNDNL